MFTYSYSIFFLQCNIALQGKWLYIGLTRPTNEWDSAWTAESVEFQWLSTGQELGFDSKYYVSSFDPSHLQPQHNCVQFQVASFGYKNFTTFGAYDPWFCLDQLYFICEIPL